MYVSDLALTDFRSYREALLSLDPGITAFVGPNGQGKTNLVESLGYLSTFSSHRVASDAALVRHGAARGIIQAKVMRDGRASVLELELVAGKANRARLNRAPLPRTRELLGILRTVVFAPEDLSLVKGDPDGRRRFLDELLVLLSPKLAGVRSDYERVVRQRNALLKSAAGARKSGASGDLRTLDVWDEKAAKAGAELIAARVRVLHGLRPHIESAYERVSSQQSVASVIYRASVQQVMSPERAELDGASQEEGESTLTNADLVEAQLLEAMSRLRPKEIERGVSLVGPHRDELELRLGELPAKGYASHGESWSLALALRLASYELLKADDWDADGEPVLILDDVFAELDTRRRRRLSEVVANAQQVLITSAVAEDVPEELDGARVDVMDSVITRVR
ncbi:DNA replication/repair protein RecF [Ruania halotolerans]|uniref:DNA replication/repair protein RecF n=1 Tax=Ruania halotolerans TaxID=2897773 RepID=UPI001E339ADF|nr:DNA replication/repair protein RecF [Ruania halotolerans]UFU06539.1 DNA replication/repair protein RecF [Ruania halotolerans]